MPYYQEYKIIAPSFDSEPCIVLSWEPEVAARKYIQTNYERLGSPAAIKIIVHDVKADIFYSFLITVKLTPNFIIKEI